MMKNKLRGWNKICLFTYKQSMNSKAMKITMAILCVAALLSMPLISLFSNMGNDEDSADKTKIEKVYVYADNETKDISQQFINKNIKSEIYGDLEYKAVEDGFELPDEDASVLLNIKYNPDKDKLDYGIQVCVYYNQDSDVKEDDANSYASFVDDNIKKALLLSSGMEETEIGDMLSSINYTIEMLDEEGNVIKDADALDQFEYWISYSFIMIGIMAVSIAGSKVAELIVTEKSTKVMEYLLTSVKPMAVIWGKVMGSTMIIFSLLGSVVLSFIGSIVINGFAFPNEDGSFAVPSMLQTLSDRGLLEDFTIINILIVIAMLVGGFVLYGLIAGIAGATVSKIEEMAEGVKLFTMTMMIGAYLPLFLIMTSSIGGSGWGALNNVVYLLPVTSMFIVPQYLFLGKISVFVALGAVAILIVSIMLMLLFVNKIYEEMLYSNGAPLKLKNIIGIAKKKSKGGNE